MPQHVRRRATGIAVAQVATVLLVGWLGAVVAGIDWSMHDGVTSLGQGGLLALGSHATLRWTAPIRVGRQRLLVTLSALPALVAAVWLPPLVALTGMTLGALWRFAPAGPVKALVNTAAVARGCVVLVVAVVVVPDPFVLPGVAVVLGCLALLQALDQTEVHWLLGLAAGRDAPRPRARQRVAGLGAAMVVDALALSAVATAATADPSWVLALPPLGLLGVAVWAFGMSSRMHDAQRHLLAVVRRLSGESEVERVVAAVLDGIDTILPVGRAAVVVERSPGDGTGAGGALDVWTADPTSAPGVALERREDHLLARDVERLHHGGRVARLRSSAALLPRGTAGPRLAAPFTLEDGTRAVLVVSGAADGAGIDREGHRELLHSLALQLGSALSRVRLDGALLASEAEREHIAAHDVLTGLPNRSTWTRRTDVLLSGGRRHDGRLAVLVVDLVGFSRCTDTLGHDAGDEALVEVARRLGSQLREPDVLARLGTDVFGVTLGDADDHVHVVAVCERLLATFDAPFELAGLHISLQARAGIAIAPDHGNTAGLLLQRAEIALATAKQERTAWSLHLEGDHEQRRRRLVLRGRLRRAVVDGGLHVHLQPKVAADDATVCGFEALARWDDDELGDVSPTEFVPEVEELGLMPAMTTAVLEQSLDALVQLRAAGHDVTVSVNVSASAVVDPGVLQAVRTGLAGRGLPGHRLVLELTESAVAGRGVVEALAELEGLGVQVSIDDYGTGWSSLSRLLELRVDELKIDRSFVAAMVEDVDAAAIVRSTVELGRALGMTTVAEGVEHEEEAVLLRQLGVDQLQGWLTGRPMRPEAAVVWMRESPSARPAAQPRGGSVVQLRQRTG